MERATVGVEEEYLLLDRESGHPVPLGQRVLAEAGAQPSVDAGEVEPELLQAQVEAETPVCRTLEEVGGHLRRLRGALAEAAARAGARLVASAAAPTRGRVSVTDRPRYRAMLADAPQLVDEQLICGMHVHVGVPDPEAAVAALSRVRPWLPVLVAMAANSPFWDGADTGFASWRTVVFGRWPVSGPPPDVADAREYRRRTEDLLKTGVIRDLGQIYWQARPSQRYPTLEVRALDVAVDPEDAVVLAGIVRGLVLTALHEEAAGAPRPAGAPPELLAAANWHAARHGLADTLIVPGTPERRPAAEVVSALVEGIAPALEAAGDAPRVRAGVERLLASGGGAARQRRVLREEGPEALLAFLGA